MHKNKLRLFAMFSVFSITAVGCNGTAPKLYTDYLPGERVETLASVELDYENAVFDDFTNGVDYDRWMIGSGAWGNGNGGVVPENVFYTEDGILILRGNGLHYARGEVKGQGILKDGRNTGSAIISKFKTGPGHYEVRMKPLPRLGACTALWTYTYRDPTVYDDADNHEIDIELPGGKTKGSINFKHVLNTNYHTVPLNISKDINLEEVSGGNIINLADGQFHTFGFDWYTDPEVIIYYIDGQITAITDLYVPYLQSRLWLGNWFPNNSGFVGDSLFETDYMEVDWVKYIPFKDQPQEEWDASVSVKGAERSQYPSSPIILPKANMISNGDFDALVNVDDINNYGWELSKLNGYKDIPVEDICFLDEKGGYENSPGIHLKEGGYLSTVVDTIYDGYKYNLSFVAKSNAEDARFIIRYRNNTEGTISSETINVTASDEFVEYTKELNPPEGTYSIAIQIYSNDEDKDISYILDDIKIERGF